MHNISSINPLKKIIIIGVLLRLFFIFFISGVEKVEYYEYGAIAKNLIEGRGYSIFYIENDSLKYKFNPNISPFPSAYMPPAYVLLISPFFCIELENIRNSFLFIFNILVFIFACIVLFNLAKCFFSEKTAFMTVLIYAILPEFIYATVQITPIILYHLLVCALLLFLTKYELEKSNRILFIISILFSIIVLIRAEFILFFFLVIVVFLYNKKLKEVLLLICVLIFFMLPWIIRNYIVFDNFIPLTTSMGVNFYRGHNPYNPGVWSDEDLNRKIMALPRDKNFEIYLNSLYLETTLNAIKNGEVNEIRNTLQKLFYHWFFNPNFKESFHLAYIVPWLLLLGISVFGIIKSFDLQKFKFFYIFLFYHTILVIIFFSIPRYQIMMKIGLIPFCAYGIELMFLKYKNFVKKN